MGKFGFFDVDKRLAPLSAKGDPLRSNRSSSQMGTNRECDCVRPVQNPKTRMGPDAAVAGSTEAAVPLVIELNGRVAHFPERALT